MRPQLSTILPELIDCVAQGRAPSPEKLFRVADHIRKDMSGSRAAFSWGPADAGASQAELALRAAQTALFGDGRSDEGMALRD